MASSLARGRTAVTAALVATTTRRATVRNALLRDRPRQLQRRDLAISIGEEGYSGTYKRTLTERPFNVPATPSSQFRLFATNGNDWDNQSNNDNGKETTPKGPWHIPEYVPIPQDRLEWSFVRSSGAGGQNVNKVNTCVQVRFHVASSEWIGPWEVRQRLMEQQASRMNKDGYLLLRVQEHRTQTQNRTVALQKLQEIILQAYPRPVVRKKRTGISQKTKNERKEFKRRRSLVKESRRRIDF